MVFLSLKVRILKKLSEMLDELKNTSSPLETYFDWLERVENNKQKLEWVNPNTVSLPPETIKERIQLCHEAAGSIRAMINQFKAHNSRVKDIYRRNQDLVDTFIESLSQQTMLLEKFNDIVDIINKSIQNSKASFELIDAETAINLYKQTRYLAPQ